MEILLDGVKIRPTNESFVFLKPAEPWMTIAQFMDWARLHQVSLGIHDQFTSLHASVEKNTPDGQVVVFLGDVQEEANGFTGVVYLHHTSEVQIRLERNAPFLPYWWIFAEPIVTRSIPGSRAA